MTYHSEDKLSVKFDTPIPNITKQATGIGSNKATLELIGGKPDTQFNGATIDFGFSVVTISQLNGELKMAVNTNEYANWEGINKYNKQDQSEIRYQEWRSQYKGKLVIPPELHWQELGISLQHECIREFIRERNLSSG